MVCKKWNKISRKRTGPFYHLQGVGGGIVVTYHHHDLWKKTDQILKKKQIGESVRELGLAGEQMKSGTPTMGGIIILLAILIPTLLLLSNLDKVYVRLMLLCTVWLGVIGFVDDYLKIRARKISKEKGIAYKKTNADGLAGKFKIFGQVILGIIIGATLYFNPNVVVKREIMGSNISYVCTSAR